MTLLLGVLMTAVVKQDITFGLKRLAEDRQQKPFVVSLSNHHLMN